MEEAAAILGFSQLLRLEPAEVLKLVISPGGSIRKATLDSYVKETVRTT
jgi:hypothetical protein